MTPGIIILIVVLAAFLAMIIGGIVAVLKGPSLPAGLRFEGSDGNNKAIVILDEAIPMIKDPATNQIVSIISDGSIVLIADIVKSCASAITTTEAGFTQMGIQKADINEVIFVYETDQRYEKDGALGAIGSAAYSIEIPGFLGIKRAQAAIIRSKYAKLTVDSGEPPIHELIHILNKQAGRGYDEAHADIKLWGKFGAATAQTISDNLWIGLKKK